MAPDDLDGPDLQRFLVDTEMDLAPDPPFGATMLARMPLAVRKTLATAITVEGDSEFEVMAVLAHGSPQEAARYTKKAQRRKLADSALARLTGAENDRILSNPSDELGNTDNQTTERK